MLAHRAASDSDHGAAGSPWKYHWLLFDSPETCIRGLICEHGRDAQRLGHDAGAACSSY